MSKAHVRAAQELRAVQDAQSEKDAHVRRTAVVHFIALDCGWKSAEHMRAAMRRLLR